MDNIRIFAFRHIPETAFCLTHYLLIIMANTHRTNPHIEEPTHRRSARNAPRGKSPTARKKQSVSRKTNTSAAAANTSRKKNTSAAAANTHDDDTANTHDDDTSARKKAAPSKGLRTVFRGQRKSPPELIPLGPVPREAVVESLMPTRIPLVPARPVRNNRTGLPEPPKVLNLPGDAFVNPFDNDDVTLDVGEDGNTVFSGGKSGDEDYHDCEEEEPEVLHDVYDVCDDDSGDKDYVPPGCYSDDDDFDHLNDDDIDEEDRRITDMQRSKSPVRTGRRRGNLISGGPVAPNYSLMTPEEADEERKKYNAERKTWRDSRRRDRLRGNKGSSFDESEYTGDLTPTLRPMTLVQASRLQVGQTFPESGLVKLRVAEEANHRGIYFSVDKSDESRIVCKGDGGFLVQAANSDAGWRISTCTVLAEQGDQPAADIAAITAVPRSPYKASYIVPLIATTIAITPLASNKVLRQVLDPYGREYCFTENIIQKARTDARKMIFGDASENVCYAHFVKADLEKAGHHVELSFTTRKETMRNLDKIILAEEAQRRKDSHIDSLPPGERKAFILQWRQKHGSKVMDALGTADEESSLKFLNGIFFAPSFSTETVPHLQNVFMADACHLNFGKYTLFSCYGVTANSNASPVAFAIIFGNESTITWRQFWQYAIQLHPSINSGAITMITDQDKGQKNALTHFLNSVGHFHCSYHRRQNIIKMCGGGSGKLPNSALWMYNKLMRCKNLEQLEYNKDLHFRNMTNKDINYLNSITDESQYPAARCAMDPSVFMYSRSSSGTAESMNKANKEMRARTAVDLLNACILLIKLEVNRHYQMKKEVWGGSSVLTPRGLEEYAATFTNLHPRHFAFRLKEYEDNWTVFVKRINVPGKKEHIVILPKQPVNDSHFGRCTCGAPQTDAVPCEHMSVVALASVVRPQITPMTIMPFWWKRSHWRLQFPLETCPEAKVTIKSVKEGRLPDFSLRLCPDWTAGSKPGRPKKGERIKSGLEAAMSKGKKGGNSAKKGAKRRRCDVCGAYGHTFEECLLLEKSEEQDHDGINVLPIEETRTSNSDGEDGNENGMEMAI